MARLFNDKCMLILFVFYSVLPVILMKSVQIPFIDNVVYRALNASSITKSINGSCLECLCFASSLSCSAVNCFPNNTCQLFSNFSLTYRIVETSGARLYFPRGVFPAPSQCCMPNITELLNKLSTSNMIYANITNPRDALIDNNGYLVTVEGNANYLDRFDPTSLKRIDSTLLPISPQWTVTYFNGAYYIPTTSTTMLVINSESLTLIANISKFAVGPRGIILLNNGQTMVLTDYDSNSLVFLNRTSLAPVNYSLGFSQKTSFPGPHGIWRVNDSFFYVTSIGNDALYSFTATGNYNKWNETSFLSGPLTSTEWSTRVTIDECGRMWLAFQISTILIYDQQRNHLGNWTIPGSSIFDIKIVDNYVMYLTDANGQIIRVNPNINCDF